MCASMVRATLRWRHTATKSHQRSESFWSLQVKRRSGLHKPVRDKTSSLVTLWLWVRGGALMTVGYYRRSEHGLCSITIEQDLCGISVPKAAAAGSRPRDGVRRGPRHCFSRAASRGRAGGNRHFLDVNGVEWGT